MSDSVPVYASQDLAETRERYAIEVLEIEIASRKLTLEREQYAFLKLRREDELNLWKETENLKTLHLQRVEDDIRLLEHIQTLDERSRKQYREKLLNFHPRKLIHAINSKTLSAELLEVQTTKPNVKKTIEVKEPSKTKTRPGVILPIHEILMHKMGVSHEEATRISSKMGKAIVSMYRDRYNDDEPYTTMRIVRDVPTPVFAYHESDHDWICGALDHLLEENREYRSEQRRSKRAKK